MDAVSQELRDHAERISHGITIWVRRYPALPGESCAVAWRTETDELQALSKAAIDRITALIPHGSIHWWNDHDEIVTRQAVVALLLRASESEHLDADRNTDRTGQPDRPDPAPGNDR